MIDWKRVDELRAEVGAEDFAEIADLFLSEMDEIVRALPTTPVDALADTLHGLKGAALNLGFADLSALCVAGEIAPAAAPLAGIASVWTSSAEAFRTRLTGAG